jgi:hypothetical protein
MAKKPDRPWIERNADYQRQWYLRNRDRILSKKKREQASHSRKWRLVKYGLSEDELANMIATQEGRCAACGALPKEGRILFIDHCHATGQVRGLLCQSCNTLAGFLEHPDRVPVENYLKLWS